MTRTILPALCPMLLAAGLLAGFVSEGFAQGGDYSGKVVYGLFGPRVLGQPLQSHANRADRGIARNAYGEFLGRNPSASGRMFSDTPRPRYGQRLPEGIAPVAVPQEPTEPAQPLPDEWLRSRGPGAEATPPAPASSGTSPSGLVPSGSAPPPEAGTQAPLRGRPAIMVGFVPEQPTGSPGAGIAAALRRSGRVNARWPIHVVVDKETAILRGRVATPQDRELIENLIRLEPGIWHVRNELTVERPGPLLAGNSPK